MACDPLVSPLSDHCPPARSTPTERKRRRLCAPLTSKTVSATGGGDGAKKRCFAWATKRCLARAPKNGASRGPQKRTFAFVGSLSARATNSAGENNRGDAANVARRVVEAAKVARGPIDPPSAFLPPFTWSSAAMRKRNRLRPCGSVARSSVCHWVAFRLSGGKATCQMTGATLPNRRYVQNFRAR